MGVERCASTYRRCNEWLFMLLLLCCFPIRSTKSSHQQEIFTRRTTGSLDIFLFFWPFSVNPTEKGHLKSPFFPFPWSAWTSAGLYRVCVPDCTELLIDCFCQQAVEKVYLIKWQGMHNSFPNNNSISGQMLQINICFQSKPAIVCGNYDWRKGGR